MSIGNQADAVGPLREARRKCGITDGDLWALEQCPELEYVYLGPL